MAIFSPRSFRNVGRHAYRFVIKLPGTFEGKNLWDLVNIVRNEYLRLS